MGWVDPKAKTSDANEKEFKAAIDRAGGGNLKAMILGSETLLRGDLNEGQLISYLERFKKVFPEVPVATADSYADLIRHPAVVDKCDFIFANIYLILLVLQESFFHDINLKIVCVV